MLKLLGRVLFLGLVAAAVYALWKKLTGSDDPYAAPASLRPAAVPTPAVVAATVAPPTAGAASAWVEPDEGACPISHPVKAKLSSGIFHVPGGQNYDRTKADRCYTDAGTAELDGLRQAKR